MTFSRSEFEEWSIQVLLVGEVRGEVAVYDGSDDSGADMENGGVL
jgi:hypothetical protein